MGHVIWVRLLICQCLVAYFLKITGKIEESLARWFITEVGLEPTTLRLTGAVMNPEAPMLSMEYRGVPRTIWSPYGAQSGEKFGEKPMFGQGNRLTVLNTWLWTEREPRNDLSPAFIRVGAFCAAFASLSPKNRYGIRSRVAGHQDRHGRTRAYCSRSHSAIRCCSAQPCYLQRSVVLVLWLSHLRHVDHEFSHTHLSAPDVAICLISW
jgi:hypothetical protein